jgi:glutamate-1-semialdehyde 2,1-aminomutase
MVSTENYPVERLLADGKRIFAGREYRAVCFGDPTPSADNAKDTAYAAAAGKMRGVYPLMVAGAPLKVPREILKWRVEDQGFLGYKVFLNWQGDDYGNIGIRDMLGANEMDLADELGLVVLLHVPGSGRLADPEVQSGVKWLSEGWPNARIVLAHCGRCYLPSEMEKAVGALRDLSNIFLDTSMVMDESVLRMVFEGIDSDRVLFGTDFPIAAMRGRRVRVMDHWVDVVFGDYPPSSYRVRAPGIRATFMAWEIALAVRKAGRAVGLPEQRVRDVFFENGMRVLHGVRAGAQIVMVEEGWES